VAALVASARAQDVSSNPTIDVWLDEFRAASAGLQTGVLESFDVTPSHFVLIGTKHKLYVVGRGGMLPLELEFGVAESFAFVGNRTLFVVHGPTLCAVAADGQGCDMRLQLPENGLRVATSRWAGQAYLFETAVGESPYGLYALQPAGTLDKLLDVQEPIEAVGEIGGHVLFASGSAIYELDDTRNARVLVTMPRGHAVRSLAMDPERNRVFVSDLRTM
jgi:hypothetical protein